MIFNMANPSTILLTALLAFLGFLLSIYIISVVFRNRNRMSTRIEHFVGYEGLTDLEFSAENKILSREIEGSLFTRTVISWLKKILGFLGRFTPDRMVSEIEHKLTVAGNPGGLRAREFFAIRMLTLTAGVGAALWVNRDFQNLDLMSIVLGIALLGMGALLPNYWLSKKMQARQREITQNLPDALDMLSVCASAGLGFDQSLQKISAYWDTELGWELQRVTREMEMGIPRTTALRNLADRVDVQDLSRFIALIIQAERVGMSYADVLHSQAIQMRIQRQYRARELANKLPGKMIVPVALFIFPAMLVVILGPSLPVLLDVF